MHNPNDGPDMPTPASNEDVVFTGVMTADPAELWDGKVLPESLDDEPEPEPEEHP